MFDNQKKTTMSFRKVVSRSFYKSGSSRLETCRDDNFLLNNAVSGFTLIELLVVVLIIGILASVALPQYQKAVEKARMSEAIIMVEEIARANELFRLENGAFTRDINELVLEIPGEDMDYSGIPGKQTNNFIFAASNAVGEQTHIAVAQKLPGQTRYALMVSSARRHQCNIYSGASSYEKKLCTQWADEGYVSDFSQN